MTTISLFPLSSVLLPHGKMPLQIFEQRYLDLVRSSMKTADPFGIVWVRRGSEVAERGRASSELGDWGTLARIVDWDQLPNGLLGITIQGEGRFDLYDTETQSSGLVMGEVVYRDEPARVSMQDEWRPMLDVLQSLESHPHVQLMNLQLDYTNAWQVAWALIQLLPLEEYLKYELLGLDAIEEVMNELDLILNQISGED
ncbi:MAG: LON peptidase substrate-binding domain-containing protein [Halioglobus sp.]